VNSKALDEDAAEFRKLTLRYTQEQMMGLDAKLFVRKVPELATTLYNLGIEFEYLKRHEQALAYYVQGVNLVVVNRTVHRNTEPYLGSLQPYVIIQNRVLKVRLT
jgi:cell fate (sporulation/competence/biofilm development) regulator YlbF (YheA/YmcA/DUF963 family)